MFYIHSNSRESSAIQVYAYHQPELVWKYRQSTLSDGRMSKEHGERGTNRLKDLLNWRHDDACIFLSF